MQNLDKYVLFLNLRGILDEQYKALYAAHEAGFKVILLSSSIPSNLRNLIAHFETADNNEDATIEKACKLAAQYNICGVFSWTDTDVILSAKISKVLGLLAPDPEAVYVSKNKYEMRKLVAEKHPELVPTFTSILSIDDINNSVITYPAVLKPISASGSKGIFIVQNKDEAIIAYNELTNLTDNKAEGWLYNRYGNKFILEEFIDGQEFSVEGFVYDSEFYLAGITDKKTTNPWCIEYQHIFPACYSSDISNAIIDATQKIIKTLNLDHCPIHLEAKFNHNKVKLVEIAARSGGDLIHSHLIENSTGVNWLKVMIGSIGHRKKPNLEYMKNNKITGIRFVLSGQSKIFNGFNIQPNIYSVPGVLLIKETTTRGSAILLPPEDFSSERLGYVMIEGASFDDVNDKLHASVQCLL